MPTRTQRRGTPDGCPGGGRITSVGLARAGVGRTGVVAEMGPDHAPPWARVDMDALPVEEPG